MVQTHILSYCPVPFAGTTIISRFREIHNRIIAIAIAIAIGIGIGIGIAIVTTDSPLPQKLLLNSNARYL